MDDLLENVLLPGRAGLAAPQIGVSLAAFSYNIDALHGYVINPVVVETSGEYDGPEGCLSTRHHRPHPARGADRRHRGRSRRRPGHRDRRGRAVPGLAHETDHLRGILFIDRLTGERRKEVLGQLRRAARPVSGAAG